MQSSQKGSKSLDRRTPAYKSKASSQQPAGNITEFPDQKGLRERLKAGSWILQEEYNAPELQAAAEANAQKDKLPEEDKSREKLESVNLNGSWVLDLDANDLGYIGVRIRYWPDSKEIETYEDFELQESLRRDPETKALYIL